MKIPVQLLLLFALTISIYANAEESTGAPSVPEYYVYRNTENLDSLVNILRKQRAPKAITPPQELSGECAEFCNSCEDSTGAFSDDALCQKIDLTCKCTDFIEQTKIYAAEKAKDSLEIIETQLKKIENSKIIQDTLRAICDSISNCLIKFSVDYLDRSLIELKVYQDLKKKSQKIL